MYSELRSPHSHSPSHIALNIEENMGGYDINSTSMRRELSTHLKNCTLISNLFKLDFWIK